MAQEIFPLESTVWYDDRYRLAMSAALGSHGRSGILPALASDIGFRSFVTGQELLPYCDSSGMQVKVKSGMALLDGMVFMSTAEETLEVSDAHASMSRIDAVVIDVDYAIYDFSIKIVEGPSQTTLSEDDLPELTNNSTHVQLLLGYIYVPSGAATLSATNCADMRNYTAQKKVLRLNIGTGRDAIEAEDTPPMFSNKNNKYFAYAAELIGTTASSITMTLHGGSSITFTGNEISTDAPIILDSESYKLMTRDPFNYLVNASGTILSWRDNRLLDMDFIGANIDTAETLSVEEGELYLNIFVYDMLAQGGGVI